MSSVRLHVCTFILTYRSISRNPAKCCIIEPPSPLPNINVIVKKIQDFLNETSLGTYILTGHGMFLLSPPPQILASISHLVLEWLLLLLYSQLMYGKGPLSPPNLTIPMVRYYFL